MHPFVKILTFIVILLLMNFLHGELLLGLCILVSFFATMLEFKRFFVVIKRMRLFFISIFVIYAFATPGEYVAYFPIHFAPTYEGLNLGLVQIERLVISLAALSLLLNTSSKEVLMVGLYMLLLPFKFLGLKVDKFTARLLLTFEYVEALASSKSNKLSFNQLDDIHAESENLKMDRVVVLPSLPFNLMDKLMMIIFIGAAFALIAFKVMA